MIMEIEYLMLAVISYKTKRVRYARNNQKTSEVGDIDTRRIDKNSRYLILMVTSYKQSIICNSLEQVKKG